MNPPTCPNFLEHRCPQSNTFVESERQNCFVIKCRTCGCRNIWPCDTEDKRGRYEGALRQQLQQRQLEESLRRKKAYSLPGG
jgi:hypothetical protein